MAYKPFIKNSNGELEELPLYADTAGKFGTKDVGNINNPIYLANGVPTNCERTIPTVRLNGTTTNYPSFYAPLNSGTKGYFLMSNGEGYPSWVKHKNETVLWSGVQSLSLSSNESRPKTKTFTIEKDLISSVKDEIYLIFSGYHGRFVVPAYLYESGSTFSMSAKFDEFVFSSPGYAWEHGEIHITGSGTSYTATLKCDAKMLTFPNGGNVTSSNSPNAYVTLTKIIKLS